LFATPEQTELPRVLLRANELVGTLQPAIGNPLRELRADSGLCQAHLTNLSSPEPRRRGQVDPHLAIARAKIEEAESFSEALGYLNTHQTFAVLNAPTVLTALLALPDR
jgi:membrane glycosyltransferase